MIYSYNTLGYYETKANRQYDNTGNIKILHHFETNNTPSFQIIVDSTVIVAYYDIYDIDDVWIYTGTVTVENDTNNAGTEFSRLISTGDALSGKDDGFYYIEISYDSNTLYSDVFCWETDVSEYLKIEATTSNMSIGGFENNMTDFTYLVYLEGTNFTEEYEVEEEGVERTYGNESYFNSRNHVVEYEITGYRKTLGFLSGIRTVGINGTVTVTFDSESYEIYDIGIPEKSSSYNNSSNIIISWKFKLKDYLQVRNNV